MTTLDFVAAATPGLLARLLVRHVDDPVGEVCVRHVDDPAAGDRRRGHKQHDRRQSRCRPTRSAHGHIPSVTKLADHLAGVPRSMRAVTPARSMDKSRQTGDLVLSVVITKTVGRVAPASNYLGTSSGPKRLTNCLDDELSPPEEEQGRPDQLFRRGPGRPTYRDSQFGCSLRLQNRRLHGASFGNLGNPGGSGISRVLSPPPLRGVAESSAHADPTTQP